MADFCGSVLKIRTYLEKNNQNLIPFLGKN